MLLYQQFILAVVQGSNYEHSVNYSSVKYTLSLTTPQDDGSLQTMNDDLFRWEESRCFHGDPEDHDRVTL
ncbi:hypothetical protein EG68_02841 [Paragonimus skrjabini miyazakii]|uniref:Uncharacterized protein n=1 Tax=Paragonimus skrjabini miyazakii TaxID=59628 RepID=A0A8S9YX29_9TREM|nr:hypothetical protein EG68_02841 [Paragonimus skrjabini miyazakii]